MERIVIAGGSGLIGRALIPVLRAAGHQAVALRRPYSAEALEGATVIINLAGESLSDGRWTTARKKGITESRVRSLQALQELVSNGNSTVKTLISASAIGYYGSATNDHVYTEQDAPGTDFLADVCTKWEAAALGFETSGIRVVRVRIGVVFSEEGGALPKMMMPLKFGVSVPLGSGKQWIPWIHINDLARLFLFLIENKELNGAFNAVAPNPLTNRELMKRLAQWKRRLFIPVGVPGFLLRLVLGEMAAITLEGSRVSCEKLIESGFRFEATEFPEVS
jgi:uncharacterized protein (TIGR01777 family)